MTAIPSKRYFPGDQPVTVADGRSVFEWMAGGQLLIQRTDLSETAEPGSGWTHDFHLSYTRAG
ncbi:MAG TPA: hypothetical protein VG014_07145 [Acidimicrobiales bacterium]|jgi:hypothetical protein|nr:hypothetical protein [Acidimicrobiales bacterium]